MRRLLTPAELGPDPVSLLRSRLEECRGRIHRAATRAGRSADDVLLLPVTKYVDVDVIRALWSLGLRDFAENRVQEALAKVDACSDLDGARFHFIGHLQRNKARRSVEAFHSLHALDSVRLARDLERHLEATPERTFDIWVEVNVSGEDQKTGLAATELDALLDVVRQSSLLGPRCRGLMGMAPHHPDPDHSRGAFRKLRELRDQAIDRGQLPENAGLSMGMSGDFEVAVEEGSTVVRVGSLLYR